MKALPLEVGARECVRCGYCCKVRSCGFGEWDPQANCCKELIRVEDGAYGCRKYEEIISGSKDWWCSPAFGAGCCSVFNGDRLAIVRGCMQSE